MPIFRESFFLKIHSLAHGTAGFLAVPAAADEQALVPAPVDEDAIQVVPDMPVDFEIGTDTVENSIRRRSMSKAALTAEATSATHLAAHYFCNARCNICMFAHFFQFVVIVFDWNCPHLLKFQVIQCLLRPLLS